MNSVLSRAIQRVGGDKEVEQGKNAQGGSEPALSVAFQVRGVLGKFSSNHVVRQGSIEQEQLGEEFLTASNASGVQVVLSAKGVLIENGLARAYGGQDALFVLHELGKAGDPKLRQVVAKGYELKARILLPLE
jgi:hypothetical protein